MKKLKLTASYVRLKTMYPTFSSKSLIKKHYIHVNSYHPLLILKYLPISMEKRSSCLSLSKEIIQETVPSYELFFSNCGYEQNLNYCDPTPPNLFTKGKQQRNISWFILPYSMKLKKNIVSSFCT